MIDCLDSGDRHYDQKYLGELAKLADQKPVELDPWDPMGTLAD